MLNFNELNLNPSILETLEKKGYTSPTPIQAQAIPHLLEGKDLLGIAQTGTGKTAAFSLPILDKLARDKITLKANQVRVLILAPTRELATQIVENIETYGKGFDLKYAVIFGGVNEFHQIKSLKTGLDILVATPGRLLDLSSQGHIDFSQVEIFVLDEADRMLDMGFINDVKKIISKLPVKKQSLLFSATMPESISGLANSILKNPVKVEVTPQSTTVERINQKVYFVEKANKLPLLLDVIIKEEVIACLVFCKTKHQANKVVAYLQKYDVKAAAIHGNKSQPAREKALNSFREGKIKILVATDIAARGIDVSTITHIVNFEIPIDPESYVHRIGRTARAGREGVAISFCDGSENHFLKAVEKAIKMKIPVDNTHLFFGKAAIPSADEGRILSRGNQNKANSSSANVRDNQKSDTKSVSRGSSRVISRSNESEKRVFSDRNSNHLKPRHQDENYSDRGNRSFGDKRNSFDRSDNKKEGPRRDFRSDSRTDSRDSRNDRFEDRNNRNNRFDSRSENRFESRDKFENRGRNNFRNSERDSSQERSFSKPFSKPFSKEFSGNSSRNSSKPYSKNSSSFNSENKFNNNFNSSFSNNDEPLTKKILRKFGFGKFAKDSEKPSFLNSDNKRDYSSRSGFNDNRSPRSNSSRNNSSRSNSFRDNKGGNSRPRTPNFGNKR